MVIINTTTSKLAVGIAAAQAIFSGPDPEVNFQNAVNYRFGKLWDMIYRWIDRFKQIQPDMDLVEAVRLAIASGCKIQMTPEQCAAIAGSYSTRVVSSAMEDVDILNSELIALAAGHWNAQQSLDVKNGWIKTAKYRIAKDIISECKERAMNDDPVPDNLIGDDLQLAYQAKIKSKQQALVDMGISPVDVKRAQFSGKSVTIDNEGIDPYEAYGYSN